MVELIASEADDLPVISPPLTSQAQIARLSQGLTMMAWVRWNDATQTRLQPPVTIGNEVHPGVWNPNPSPNPYPNPNA